MADPPRSGRFVDLIERFVAAAAFAALAVVAIGLGGWVAVLFAMAAGGVMIWEWRRISLGEAAGAAPPAAGFQITAVAGAALLGFASGAGPAVVFLVVVAGAGAVADGMVLKRPPGWSFFGAVYIGLALICFVAVLESPEQGLGAVVWVVLVVIATDVGAYFVGRLIGGPKLWPRVSPGKTWSGAVGGAASGVVAAIAFSLIAGSDGTVWTICAALLISMISQAGDLGESAYKRRFGVKDSGTIMPGHGGLLDRMDGMIAAMLAAGAFAALWPNAPIWAW